MISALFFGLFCAGAVLGTIRYTQERYLVSSLYLLVALAAVFCAINTLPMAFGP